MVRFQLALSLGEVPSAERLKALSALARRSAADRLSRAAILSSSGEAPLDLFRLTIEAEATPRLDEFFFETAQVIGARLDKAEITGLLEAVVGKPRSAPSLRSKVWRRVFVGAVEKTSNVPAAADFLTKLRDSQEQEIRAAAGEVASLVRVLTPEARKTLIDQAATTSLAEDRPLDERRRAIDTLATVNAREVVSKLEELLHPRQNEAIRFAALRALNEQSGPEVARVLIDAWRGLTPGLQAQAVERRARSQGSPYSSARSDSRGENSRERLRPAAPRSLAQLGR